MVDIVIVTGLDSHKKRIIRMSRVLDNISDLLKQPSHKIESSDLVVAEIQQVKSEIHEAFSNQQHQLQLREQWILDQVDNIYECLISVAQKHSEKIAEVRGKLQCCVELSKLPQLKDCKNFEKLVSNLIHSYQNLTKQEVDGISAIKFDADEIGLTNVVRRFGSVTSHALHGDDESSVCSWDLGESDTDSGVTKQVQDFVVCGNTCGGGCSQKPGIAIEDLNQFFSEEMMQPDIDEVCKANETCASFANCICEESCLANVQSGLDRPQPYVSAIGNAFDAIINGKPNPVQAVGSNSGDVVMAQQKFDEQVASLEMQFQEIISGTYMPAEIMVRCDTKEPWSVENLANDIDDIIHRDSETVLTTSPGSTSVNKEAVIPKQFHDLGQHIMSILNDEMPMYGVNNTESSCDTPKSFGEQIDSLGKHLKSVLSSSETDGSEKVDFEKDRAVDDKKKWTTVHELDTIIAGILQ